MPLIRTDGKRYIQAYGRKGNFFNIECEQVRAKQNKNSEQRLAVFSKDLSEVLKIILQIEYTGMISIITAELSFITNIEIPVIMDSCCNSGTDFK